MSAQSEKPICPVCGRALAAGVAARFRPFCSRRCADIDLGRWLKGGYAIAGDPADQAAAPPKAGEPDEED